MLNHPLPLGTQIRTIGGAAQGDWDEDEDDDGEAVMRETAPGEIGRVVHPPENHPGQGWTYSVAFSPSNVWVFLDEAEVNDPTRYEVIPLAA